MRRYALPLLGDLAVGDIDIGAILRVLEQNVPADESFGFPAGSLWTTRPETANRVRGRIESVLDWAKVRGYRTGDNPARWRGYLSVVFPARGKIQKTVHHKALPFAELAAFMTELRRREGVAAKALEFTILTGSRTGEVRGATWGEIDFAGKVWAIPAERMKAGKEHRVPLSPPALSLLQSAYRQEGNPFVFIGPTGGGLSHSRLAQIRDRRMAAGKNFRRA